MIKRFSMEKKKPIFSTNFWLESEQNCEKEETGQSPMVSIQEEKECTNLQWSSFWARLLNAGAQQSNQESCPKKSPWTRPSHQRNGFTSRTYCQIQAAGIHQQNLERRKSPSFMENSKGDSNLKERKTSGQATKLQTHLPDLMFDRSGTEDDQL